MKKNFFILCCFFVVCTLLSACSKKIDYTNYISEERYNIYLYSSDDTQIKIYAEKRENPFCTDGIKGNVENVIEVFVTLPKTCQKAEIATDVLKGELSYNSKDCNYYLSGTGTLSGDSVKVKLSVDGEEQSYTATSVLYSGVITPAAALACVVERESELMESLTEGNIFKGEIYVRLLYDEGCYYYVGICTRDKKIKAFLVDGERGKIITTKELNV
jgi:hypothetical protein